MLLTNGYLLINEHLVAGNTNPYPSEPCTKLLLTLTCISLTKSIVKYC